MAHRKAGGTARSFRDSNPQYLGTELYAGEKASTGDILVRQRGSTILAGKNVGMGKDYTLFALKDGIVEYGTKRKLHFDGTNMKKKVANIITQ